ncbi:hypothetical protein [Streptomyces sp. HUAS TT20]|uniref:hypothetical protein n=1 Tax=Streptomyces sp. HUAS TT20 TaxID=3447509 RepID=UPI0021DB6051|nr:hypothetical protein [Streptomyces sp. HUAS 15-9]UXY29545.1 hypothetical protein N8I87_25310 [Streptomyces sp. HUAS 15-9]
MSPDSGVGGPGTVEAEPRLGQGGATDRSPSDTAASVGHAPTSQPSATSVMGGENTTPTSPTTSPLPTDIPSTIPTAAPRTTQGPTAPRTTSAPDTTPPTAPRPDPTSAPTPSHSQTAPAPQPSHDGGLCVPIIGLCVDPLRAPRDDPEDD